MAHFHLIERGLWSRQERFERLAPAGRGLIEHGLIPRQAGAVKRADQRTSRLGLSMARSLQLSSGRQGETDLARTMASLCASSALSVALRLALEATAAFAPFVDGAC